MNIHFYHVKNDYLAIHKKEAVLDMTRKKVILVDHNDKDQAVDGIEDAETQERNHAHHGLHPRSGE